MGKRSNAHTRSSSPNQKTVHHMVPRSRCPPGISQYGNVVKLERRYHAAWHALFSNMTPFEIVVFLVGEIAHRDYFIRVEIQVTWRGIQERYKSWCPLSRVKPLPIQLPYEWNELRTRAWALLFGSRDLYSVIHEILLSGRWAPQRYFRKIDVMIDYHGRRISLKRR